MPETTCNGLCVMGHEVLPGGRGVAIAHPDCEKHARVCPHGRYERQVCSQCPGAMADLSGSAALIATLRNAPDPGGWRAGMEDDDYAHLASAVIAAGWVPQSEVRAAVLREVADRLDVWEFPAGSDALEPMYRLVQTLRAEADRLAGGEQR